MSKSSFSKCIFPFNLSRRVKAVSAFALKNTKVSLCSNDPFSGHGVVLFVFPHPQTHGRKAMVFSPAVSVIGKGLKLGLTWRPIAPF